jgi:hypothetical protein
MRRAGSKLGITDESWLVFSILGKGKKSDKVSPDFLQQNMVSSRNQTSLKTYNFFNKGL